MTRQTTRPRPTSLKSKSLRAWLGLCLLAGSASAEELSPVASPQQRRGIYDEARNALEDGRYRQACMLFRQGFDAAGTDAAYALGLAECHRQLGNYAASLFYLDLATQHLPPALESQWQSVIFESARVLSNNLHAVDIEYEPGPTAPTGDACVDAAPVEQLKLDRLTQVLLRPSAHLKTEAEQEQQRHEVEHILSALPPGCYGGIAWERHRDEQDGPGKPSQSALCAPQGLKCLARTQRGAAVLRVLVGDARGHDLVLVRQVDGQRRDAQFLVNQSGRRQRIVLDKQRALVQLEVTEDGRTLGRADVLASGIRLRLERNAEDKYWEEVVSGELRVLAGEYRAQPQVRFSSRYWFPTLGRDFTKQRKSTTDPNVLALLPAERVTIPLEANHAWGSGTEWALWGGLGVLASSVVVAWGLGAFEPSQRPVNSGTLGWVAEVP